MHCSTTQITWLPYIPHTLQSIQHAVPVLHRMNQELYMPQCMQTTKQECSHLSVADLVDLHFISIITERRRHRYLIYSVMLIVLYQMQTDEKLFGS